MSAFRKWLHLLAKPARTLGGRGGLVVQTWRGCGTSAGVFAMGRVLREPGFGLGRRADPVERDLVDLLRRFLRRGVGGAVLEARFAGACARVQTDRDGYFQLRIAPAQALETDRVWHTLTLDLISPEAAVAIRDIPVFVPSPQSRFLVVSDIDDTVMLTGVGNKLVMLWRLFARGARSRVAFPGVAALYRALHGGAAGDARNPMVYVSRAPWSLYEVFEAFFGIHNIPEGPVLFLRDWGLTMQRPLPRRAENHKHDLISTMLALFPDHPVILIGDSGQHDPEVYARILREHPGRVAAVYIRDVSRDPSRTAAIETLAREVADENSPLVLAADSFAMAEHAAALGLIAPSALPAVLAERRADPTTEADAAAGPVHAAQAVRAAASQAGTGGGPARRR